MATNSTCAIKVWIKHVDVHNYGYGYVKFTYLDDTVHEFRLRGNGGNNQFYNASSGSWSNHGGVRDHSLTTPVIQRSNGDVTTNTGDTEKQYHIECTSVTGVNTWIFEASDGGVKEVELAEDSLYPGFRLGV